MIDIVYNIQNALTLLHHPYPRIVIPITISQHVAQKKTDGGIVDRGKSSSLVLAVPLGTRVTLPKVHDGIA